ncbi:MAG: trimethylamine methyltransferase family protein [Deltaproteobacteria bacterium]|nr:trimethylamine methyltransferase family protein [Deltaproteobacteria bacterium]MBW2677464.1 trimethylamine methyltransferase family protein [Deltaproteobacteria bacterium]
MDIQLPEINFKPRLNVINAEQIKQIHTASLEVLERIGVKMTHPRAVELLESAGANVDGDRVRIPSWMVEDAIRKAPSRVVLGKRNGERSVFIEAGKTWFGPSLDCIDYLDPMTDERKRFTSEHCRVSATIADAMPNFDWSMIIGMADDQPPDIADRVIVRQALTYCEKPLVFCCKDTNSERDIYEMALLICGGKENFEKAPTIVQYSEPISPLEYYDPAVDKMLFSVEHGIPLINFPAPQACGSAPATLAGTIVQGSAESLSGLVLAQAARPGAAFIYGAFTTIMDMKTSVFSYGASEMSLMVAAMAQMAEHYNLPFFGTGGCTDAKFCDPQAAVEATFQCFSSAAVGTGLIHDCSSWMDHGSLVSPAFMVLVNEILHNVKQYMNGIPVSAETLAIDVIERVGPGGHYLQDEHTLANFNKVRYSELFERTIRQEWEADGSKSFEDRLRQMTVKAMAHEPAALPDDIVKEIDTMQQHWK